LKRFRVVTEGQLHVTEIGKVVFDAIRQLMTPPTPKRRRIGFQAKGQK
jgi:hypothetical protein